MIKASLRGLLHRKLRLTLAVVAIVLSVGFLSGALVLADTLTERFSSLFSAINQNVAVSVTARQGSRLTAEQLKTLAEVDGVSAYSGDVSSEGVIPFRSSDGEEVTAQVSLGIGMHTGGDPLGLLELRSGDWPSADDQVAVTAYTAEQAKVGLGDSLKVWLPGTVNEARTFRVVGIAGYSGDRDSLAGETLVVFGEAYAQRAFYGGEGLFAGASFAAADGVGQAELKQRIAAKLPADFEAKTGEEANREQTEAVSRGFDFFKWILVGFAVVAAVVGVFLIFNTFNIIVAQRTRELALLRAMGAGWGQVTGSVLLEALIVGFVGSTLGLGFGTGVGAAGDALLGKLIQLPSGGLIVAPLTVVLAYLLGIAVTMVAAFVPAIRASMVPPVAAMRDVVRPDKSLKAISITGTAMFLPGLALVLLGALGDLGGNAFLMLLGGAVLLLVGVLLLSPLLAKPLVRAVGALIARGQAGRLGVRNALRNPRRTAVTAVALTIGVTMVGTAATVVESFKSTISDLMGESVGVEVIIQASSNSAPDGRQGFDPKALDRVRAIPGVREAAAWHLNGANVTVDGQQVFFVFATDVAQAQRMFSIEAVEGQVRGLQEQELVVDSNSAESLGLHAGEKTTVKMGPAVKEYTVVGVYKATPMVNGIMLGEPAVADFPGPLAFQGMVSLDEGVDAAAVVSQVEQIMKDYPHVRVGDQQSYIEQATSQFDFLLYAIQVLLGVALVIALFGILNTLLLSIVERTRELGLVRAIGLDRRGVIRMISIESVLITVFGAVLGLGLGVGLGAAFTQALITAEFATVIDLPWGDLAVYLGVAVIAGVLAAIWPAWRAARTNVLEAIAYE